MGKIYTNKKKIKMADQATQCCNNFCSEYYNTLQNNRANLINMYKECSIMTYEGDKFQGLQNIHKKISEFAFQNIQFKQESLEWQNSPIDGGVLIFITGKLVMDNDANNVMDFSQVFQVCPNGQGGFYIHNDIFSLVM